ncbi:MAG: glycosyltransferase family 39 protein [Anaerolineae bacterium]
MMKPSNPLRWAFLAMLGVTLIAFLTRAWSLGDASLWFDEGLSVAFAGRSLPAMLTTLIREDLHPPLYYLLLNVWMLIDGKSEFAVRWVSLVPGVLLIPLAYVTLTEVYARRERMGIAALAAGVPAALLVALSPFLIYTSQEARMYSLAAMWGMLAVASLLRATRADPQPDPLPEEAGADLVVDARGETRRKDLRGRWARSWPWALHTVALAGMFYTLYLTAFLVPALFIYAALCGRRVFLRWLVAIAVAFVLFLPWLGPAVAQMARLAAHPDFAPADLNPIGVIERILGSFLAIGSTRLALLLLAVALIAAALFLVRRWLRDKDLALRELLIVLAAGIPIALTGIAVALAPKFAARYAIVAAPALYVALVMIVFEALWRRQRAFRLAYLAILVVAMAFSGREGVRAAQNTWSPQEDARRMGQYLTERARGDDAIVLVEDAPYAFDYYYTGPTPRWGIHVGLDFENGARVLNDLLAREPGRVWVLLWHHEFADPTGMVLAELSRRSQGEPFIRTQIPGYTLMRFTLKDWSPVVAIPTPTQPIGATFGDRLKLTGVDPFGDDPGALRWIFYWQAQQQLDRDYTVTVDLVDAAGKVVATHNQAPSTPWLATAGFPVGVPVRGVTVLDLPKGLTLGEYDVRVRVWDAREQHNLAAAGADGQALGESVSLGKVTVTPEMLPK